LIQNFDKNATVVLGATVLGAVLNYGLAHAKTVRPITSDQMRQLLAASHHAGAGDMAVGLVVQQSLHLTFWTILGISSVILVLALWLPSVGIGQVDEVPAE
jgi:hypothetical protein